MNIKDKIMHDNLDSKIYKKDFSVKYDHLCRCKYPYNAVYDNVCYKCERLLKFKSSKEERKCKHKNVTSLLHAPEAHQVGTGIEISGRYKGVFSDPYCLDCEQTVITFHPPILMKDGF